MRKIIDLDALVSEVSSETSVGYDDTKKVVNGLFRVMATKLNMQKDIGIKVFGTFTVRYDEHGFPEIKFSPSHIFKHRLTVRPEMNKYGVVLDKNKVMTAKLTGICPICGTDLETRNPPKCPKCGTEPFEEGNPSDGE